MIYKYIGEEIIWKARGTNPYQKNPLSDSFSINCKNYGDLSLNVNFILNHLPIDSIIDIVYGESEFEDDENSPKKVVREIKVKNIFGKINSIHFVHIDFGEVDY